MVVWHTVGSAQCGVVNGIPHWLHTSSFECVRATNGTLVSGGDPHSKAYASRAASPGLRFWSLWPTYLSCSVPALPVPLRYYCDFYSNATKVTDAQWESFRSLLATSSEFGVSSYPNVWDRYDAGRRALDVSQSARKLDEQLKEFAQTSIKEQRRSGKRFIFNELGVGGCKDWQCKLSDVPDIYELSSDAYNGAGSFESYDNPPTLLDPFR